MLQQALSDARTKVSESPFAKFSADGAMQADLRISDLAGVEPDMRYATSETLRPPVPQPLLLRANEVIQ